jgi:hypothetical protein
MSIKTELILENLREQADSLNEKISAIEKASEIALKHEKMYFEQMPPELKSLLDEDKVKISFFADENASLKVSIKRTFRPPFVYGENGVRTFKTKQEYVNAYVLKEITTKQAYESLPKWLFNNGFYANKNGKIYKQAIEELDAIRKERELIELAKTHNLALKNVEEWFANVIIPQFPSRYNPTFKVSPIGDERTFHIDFYFSHGEQKEKFLYANGQVYHNGEQISTRPDNSMVQVVEYLNELFNN